MYNDLFNKDLFVYTGSTFDGCITIKDINGDPFYISEGDEISFLVKKTGKETTENVLSLTLTCNDEVMGEYPFKLSPQTTEQLKGDYYYYAFIRFADGDYYQIIPYTPLKASKPYGVISYSEDKNKIIARVPRVMAESDYEPALNELENFIESVDNQDNTNLIRIRHIKGMDIVLIGNCFDPNTITSAEMIKKITDKIEYVGADNPYIAGFFHSRELSEQYNYKCAIKETFGNRYIDVETILKTPVLSQNSDMIVSSIAFDMLKLKPTSDDILMIAHDEYPSYIMQDDTHFNENGYKLAAKIILKEAVNHVV